MSAVRSTESLITFRHSFNLPSLGTLQPPGSYRLVVNEMEIDGLSFMAYRRVATMHYLLAIGALTARHQVYLIDPHELELAMTVDEFVESETDSMESCC